LKILATNKTPFVLHSDLLDLAAQCDCGQVFAHASADSGVWLRVTMLIRTNDNPAFPCYTRFRNDDTDQIHDETARQSRSAFGIGLSIALI
jgi:hypothetical protein